MNPSTQSIGIGTSLTVTVTAQRPRDAVGPRIARALGGEHLRDVFVQPEALHRVIVEAQDHDWPARDASQLARPRSTSRHWWIVTVAMRRRS